MPEGVAVAVPLVGLAQVASVEVIAGGGQPPHIVVMVGTASFPQPELVQDPDR